MDQDAVTEVMAINTVSQGVASTGAEYLEINFESAAGTKAVARLYKHTEKARNFTLGIINSLGGREAAKVGTRALVSWMPRTTDSGATYNQVIAAKSQDTDSFFAGL